MTTKLYYEEPYTREFTADITCIDKKGDKFYVQLDRTAFFPEGGGQPCDRGVIGEIKVVYVYEESGTVIHVMKEQPDILKGVNCEIDWDRRFDHMQQHLGQHILSATIKRLYGAETVGFHLGSERSTIDIDGMLDEQAICSAETAANHIVFSNIRVDILYPGHRELESLHLRKMPVPDLDQKLRVVRINSVDAIPCCGIHPNMTGEVGLIKITGSDNRGDGLRIGFVCGARALRDYYEKNIIINRISSMLSVKYSEADSAVERINKQIAILGKEKKCLLDKIIEYEGEKMLSTAERIRGIKVITRIFEDGDLKQVKSLASRLVNADGVVALFGVKSRSKAQLMFMRSRELDEINMAQILKEVLGIVNGKGGGNPVSAQGGCEHAGRLGEAIEHAYNIIKGLTLQ